MPADMRVGSFAESELGALTILRDQPSKGYTIVSFQSNEEDDCNSLTIPSDLLDRAYALHAPKKAQK